MNLIKRLGALGILSIGLLTSCQTKECVKEKIPESSYPLIKNEKSLLKEEIAEYPSMDLFVCTRTIICLAYNRNLPGERQEYYEIGNPYEDSSGRLYIPMKLIKIHEDANKNGIDKDDKWTFNNEKDKKILWRRDQNHFPNYFIIKRDDNDGCMDREYYYTQKKAGAVHSSFSLEKIIWDRNNDGEFSEKEIVWEKN